jgi:hypothetical protein
MAVVSRPVSSKSIGPTGHGLLLGAQLLAPAHMINSRPHPRRQRKTHKGVAPMGIDDQPPCRPATDAAPMVGVVRELRADEWRTRQSPKPVGHFYGEGLTLVVVAGVDKAIGRIAGSTLKCLAVVVDAVLNLAVPPAVPLHRVPLPEMRRPEGA